MSTIMLAEDHLMVRRGLKLLLAADARYHVIAETGDGASVEALVDEARPDLLLLDLDMPHCHGAEIAARLKARQAELKILILTGSLLVADVRRALRAGADGYVLKQEDVSELMQALEAVLAGRHYVSEAIARMFQEDDAAQAATAPEPVTPREIEIMRMIARGASNKEISNLLQITLMTVRTHRKNLMDKLDLHNGAEVAAYAIKHGFYQPA